MSEPQSIKVSAEAKNRLELAKVHGRGPKRSEQDLASEAILNYIPDPLSPVPVSEQERPQVVLKSEQSVTRNGREEYQSTVEPRTSMTEDEASLLRDYRRAKRGTLPETVGMVQSICNQMSMQAEAAERELRREEGIRREVEDRLRQLDEERERQRTTPKDVPPPSTKHPGATSKHSGKRKGT